MNSLNSTSQKNSRFFVYGSEFESSDSDDEKTQEEPKLSFFKLLKKYKKRKPGSSRKSKARRNYEKYDYESEDSDDYMYLRSLRLKQSRDAFNRNKLYRKLVKDLPDDHVVIGSTLQPVNSSASDSELPIETLTINARATVHRACTSQDYEQNQGSNISIEKDDNTVTSGETFDIVEASSLSTESSVYTYEPVESKLTMLVDIVKSKFSYFKRKPNKELPPYGHKQWQAHFGRTFDIYAKLWKFQQQHRITLDTRYGLKRWQIGEVASKIGQLYYHYYLRTSETAYLVEAYSFYSAIRGRHYYHLASKELKCELMVKKLRFYARFIVVAILLQQPVTINELVAELDKQVLTYGYAYDPNDQIEWINVLGEVKAFLMAEPGVTVVNPDEENRILTIGGRINNLTVPPLERTPQMYLTLQDALIIGSGNQLVKFSELTIDMFRMVQNLEWEVFVHPRTAPAESILNNTTSDEPKGVPHRRGVSESDGRPENPHKFLLFKPSASQVLIYLASSCNDLPPNGALLVYISANGHHPQQNKHPEDYGYDTGGLITTSKSDIYRDYNREAKGAVTKNKESQILYPGDLHPFTRKPLFIVVDSDNSYAFQHIPRIFGQPLIILMSPLGLPPTLVDRKNQGSLFTLFLHNPIAGLCNCCDVYTIDLMTWQQCVPLRDAFMSEAARLLSRLRLDPMYYPFLGDIHLRLIVLRYIFCECALRLHKGFRSRAYLPRAVPALPEDLFVHHALVANMLDMTELIGIRTAFYDPSGPGPSNTD